MQQECGCSLNNYFRKDLRCCLHNKKRTVERVGWAKQAALGTHGMWTTNRLGGVNRGLNLRILLWKKLNTACQGRFLMTPASSVCSAENKKFQSVFEPLREPRYPLDEARCNGLH
jgi:hypothetical protein